MPPSGPAVAGPVLPPIANDAIVDSLGCLTPVGLNLFQQIWAGVYGGGGIIDQFAVSGDLKPVATSTAQVGWLRCDGATYNNADYPKLFAAIGTAWGTAGGNTFKVPDLRDRFPIGASATHLFASHGGALTATILQANLPNVGLTVTDPGHTHTVTDPGHHHAGGFSATSTNTAGAAAGTGSAANTGDATTGITVDSNTTGISVVTGGSDTPLDITPAYAAINWLIKT